MNNEQKNFIFKIVHLPANQDISIHILADIVKLKFPDLTIKQIEHQMLRNLCGKE